MPDTSAIAKTRHFFGIPDFFMVVAIRDGAVFVGASVGMSNLGVKDVWLWGEREIEINPKTTLQFLVDNWPRLAGPFYGNNDPSPVEIDIGGLVGRDQQGPVLHRTGVLIGFDFMKILRDLDSHSVVVIEAFLRLGDILAKLVDDETIRDRWTSCAAETDLLPADRDYFGEDDPDPTEIARETAYFAKHSGIDIEVYRQQAVWLEAQHLLWAIRDKAQGLEPNRDAQGDPTQVPEDMPGPAAIMEAATEAAALVKKTTKQFVEDAVRERNMYMRQPFIYGRWYGKGNRPYPNPSGYEGSIDITADATLVEYDTDNGYGTIKLAAFHKHAIPFYYDGNRGGTLPALVGKSIVIEGSAWYDAGSIMPQKIMTNSIVGDPQRDRSRAMFRAQMAASGAKFED